MTTEWIITHNTETQQNLHQANCVNSNESAIKDAIESSVEKAITLLPNNIQDDSLYFLAEWSNDTQTLIIIVTDDTKQKTSPEIVSCTVKLNAEDKEKHAEKIKFWTRDYLTTSSGFIRFSLVAVFSHGNRDNTELL